MHKIQTLPPEVNHIVWNKGTEQPFTGEYKETTERGTYLCRACGLALYRADAKFVSQCGWPSFDDEIPNAIQRKPDADGRRTEILCVRCHAHLGHIFSGEGYTAKNLRHCVNSLAIDFVNSETILDSEEAIVAGGCFWGMQHLLNQLPGVVQTEVGYIGGHIDHPTYHDVCHRDTGHFEATRIIYDSALLDYETLLKYFFEIHDATQRDGQGPDIGPSYRSAIFYYNETQKQIAKKIIQQLRDRHYDIATELHAANTFWKAELYHQDYYVKTQKQPYCHHRVSIF